MSRSLSENAFRERKFSSPSPFHQLSARSASLPGSKEMRDSVEFSSPGSRESTELLQKRLQSVLEVLLSPGTGNTDSRCHCGSSSHRALRLCTQTVPQQPFCEVRENRKHFNVPALKTFSFCFASRPELVVFLLKTAAKSPCSFLSRLCLPRARLLQLLFKC